MLNENVARIDNEQFVGVSVMGPGASGWEEFIQQAGFRLAGREDADVILWIDPERSDFAAIAADPRCIVAGDSKTIALCQQKQIEYVKDVDNGEALQKQLEEFGRKTREQIRDAVPAKNHGITVPPAFAAKPAEKKSAVRLQRGLKKRIQQDDQPLEEAEEQDSVQQNQRVEIVVAFPALEDDGQRLKRYIHDKSAGEYRVLEVAETFGNLVRIAEKGFFEIILVHRELPGLERDLVGNLKLLREKAPGSRIILIERETDDYSSMYKNHLSSQRIEWQVIPELPGHLISILNGYQESHVVFKWDNEHNSPPVNTLPAVRTSVLSPVLIAYHSAGGGVGKTTGATQMGFSFAEMGYKTLVVELDTDKPSLLRTVGASEDCPGLAAWNLSDFKSDEAAIEALHRTSRQVRGLYVLPVGPISPRKAVLPFHLGFEGGRSDKQMDPCAQAEVFYRAALREFQIVIVDTNTNFIDPPVYTALKMAKRIFYVMEATKVFLDSAEAHLGQAYDLGIEPTNYRIILNKCTHSDPVSLRLITQTLEIPVSQQVPLDVEGYRQAAHHGRAYKPKKGVSPWNEFCQRVLQDLEVPINTAQVKRHSLKSLLFGWKKKS